LPLATAFAFLAIGSGRGRAGPVSVLGTPESGSVAGTVQSFTDIDEWRMAAAGVGTGVVHEIDFETLPDGSPSFFGALITDEFNYTAQGVTFFPHALTLEIAGHEETGFGLFAGYGTGVPRNWIIGELVTPAAAIGVLFPGGTNISVFDQSGLLLGTEHFGGNGPNFGGFVSQEAIGSVVIDRGSNIELLQSFLFTPIPEPATFLLMSAGVFCLIRRKK
jgi:hypothetical protein